MKQKGLHGNAAARRVSCGLQSHVHEFLCELLLPSCILPDEISRRDHAIVKAEVPERLRVLVWIPG
jgi:hypothetical protein